MQVKPIRKALIPAAGIGTRMLPITKTVSKVMLPLVDKPVIQVVVEELVEAGIEEVIIVISPRQTDISDYFGGVEPHLLQQLQHGNQHKQELAHTLQALQKIAKFTYVTQPDSDVYGTGTPVLCAESYVADEPFIYTFGDDFFMSQKSSYLQLVDAYNHYGVPIVATQRRVAEEDYRRYGYVGGPELRTGEIDVRAFLEQPGKENKPGDLASLGGFIVTPEALAYLKDARADLPEGKELYFNTALGRMIADGKQVVAKEIKDAVYYDTGNKLEYMKTSVALAAQHPEIGQQFQEFLIEFINKENSK